MHCLDMATAASDAAGAAASAAASASGSAHVALSAAAAQAAQAGANMEALQARKNGAVPRWSGVVPGCQIHCHIQDVQSHLYNQVSLVSLVQFFFQLDDVCCNNVSWRFGPSN